MSHARCPGPEVLLLAAHDLLEDDDDATRAHLAACDACARARAALTRSLAAPALPFTPDDVLPALKEKLAAQDAATPTVTIGVRLLCTYCKDGAPAAETVYCAACLAPHHADCFGEHGRCAAPGCEGVQVVRTTAAPPARPRRRSWPLLALGLVVGGGAVAALTARPAAEPAVVLGGPPAPAAAPAVTTVVYPLDAALDALARVEAPGPDEPAWRGEIVRRLASQQLTVNFDATPLEEAIDFLRDVTGLSIVVEPGVDATAQQVSVRLRDVTLEAALRLLVEPVGLTWTLRDGAVVISAPGSRRVLEPRFPPARPRVSQRAPSRAELLRRAEEGARRAGLAALGSRAWDAPARLEVRDARELVVTQQAAGHAALRTWLASLGGVSVPEDLRDAWFAPANAVTDPSHAKAAEHQARLEARTLTLNFPGTPLREVTQFLTDLHGAGLRVHPALLERLGAAQVHLRVRDLSAAAALEHISAGVEGLVVDVDRDGVLLRPHDVPSLEWQLAECARRATVDAVDRELLHALETRRLTLRLRATPLGELVALLQDQTGLNLALDPRADAAVRVSLEAADLPLVEVLEQALAPVGLGMSPRDGILRLVPRAEATLRPDLEPQRTALREAPMAWPAPPVDLAAFAVALEQATGARVVLTARTRATPRLRGEGGSVADALALAERQAGLRHVWTLLPGAEQHVLVLDARHELEPLHEAIALLGAEPRWTDAPPSARAALDGWRGDLHAALRALAGVGPDGSLGAAVEAVLAADAALRDVLAGHAALAVAPGADVATQLGQVLGSLVEVRRELAALRLRRERELGELDGVLQRQEAAQKALAAKADDLQLAVARARTRLDATERAGDEAALAEARQALAAAQERQLARARELDDERRRLADERDPLLRRRASLERDLRLDEARLESQLAQREQRLHDLAPALPRVVRARTVVVARLAGGAAWAEVFPDGARAWQRRAETDAVRRVADAAAVVAAVVGADDQVAGLDGGSAADLDVPTLLDRLGERAGARATLTLSRAGARREVVVEVPAGE